jgi:hypothetical protein
VRESGPRTRRSQYAPGDPVERPPRAPSRVNGWQALAILALIAATAGWTTAIVLATRPAGVADAPAATDDTGGAIPSGNDSLPPETDSHDAPELEALLPDKVKDTPLALQSWTGETILTDDGWSNSLNQFLASNGKTATDLRVAQAYDPTQAFDGSVGIYKIAGISPQKMQDALIAAWKVDFPDAPSSAIKVDGKDVTKVDFGEDALDSYLYIRGDDVFDIETSDESIVAAAITALPPPGSTPRPVPSTSVAPASSDSSDSAAPSASGGY